VNARREPVPKAPEVVDPHIFAANRYGPRDWHGTPLECLHCRFPEGNAVHVTSEELAEALPPTPPEDRSDEIIGDRPDEYEDVYGPIADIQEAGGL
jgi:hypothetical protein